jgi:integrase
LRSHRPRKLISGWPRRPRRSVPRPCTASCRLRQSIRRAQARDLMKRNVALLCDVPRGTAGRPSKSLTLAQAADLVTAAQRHPTMHACIVVSLLTGARTEELRALTWSHVCEKVVTRIHDATRHTSRRGQRSACLPSSGRARRTPRGGVDTARAAAQFRLAAVERGDPDRGHPASSGPRQHPYNGERVSQGLRPVLRRGAKAMDDLFKSHREASEPPSAPRVQ